MRRLHSSSAMSIYGSGINRFQSTTAFALLVLTVVGFPFSALIEAIVGAGSQTFTVPYRAIIVAMSLAVIATAAFSRLAGRLNPWLTLFLALYLTRLFYDLQANFIVGNSTALQFYLVVVLAPVFAISLGGIERFRDITFARVLMGGCLIVSLLAALAQSLGRAYNPWEIYRTDAVRLGFEALNPISLGHVAGSGILAAIVILSTTRQSIFWRGLSLLAILIGGYVILQAASRGAIISIGIALLWFGITKAKRLVVIAPIIFLALAAGLAQSNVVEAVLKLQGGGVYTDASAFSRIVSQGVAIQDFLTSPLYGMHFANPALNEGDYPHNILIETGMAMGIIGLALWVIMLIKSVKTMILYLSKERPMLTLLFVQKFIGNMTSGALWGADATFILLMLVLTIRRKSETNPRPTHISAPARA